MIFFNWLEKIFRKEKAKSIDELLAEGEPEEKSQRQEEAVKGQNFQVGQKVTIKRNLGSRSGGEMGDYYHGGNLELVPLGAKAVVDAVAGENKIHLSLDRKYNRNSGWYVHPDEIAITEEQAQREAEEQKRKDSMLENVLSQVPVEKKETATGERKFEPKFNVREEFAVWMRQEFPDMPANINNNRNYESTGNGYRIEYNGGKYEIPKEREKEVYEAARLACKHGIRTTNSCVRNYFEQYLEELNTDFNHAVCGLVNLIENVSANLPHEKIHYATYTKDGRRAE